VNEVTAGSRVAKVGRWLGPALFLLVLLWPGDALTREQRSAAAVTVLTATWWVTEAVPIGLASLLPAALFPLLGVLGAKQAAPHYFDDVVMLFLGAMLIALGLERWDLHRRMALAILARVGGAPRRLVLGFLMAGVFLSLWLNNTAAALMLIPIGLAVARAVGGDGSTPLARALLLAIAYGVSVGGMGTPVGTAPNQVLIGQLRTRYEAAPEIAFGAWMLGWAPVLLLWIPLAWWLLSRKLGRSAATDAAGAAGRAGADEILRERAALGPWTRAQRTMALLFATAALAWITRADLDLGALRIPGWQRWFGAEGRVTDATVALCLAALGFLLPGEGGGRLLDWRITERMPWDVLLLIGGGFCLAAGVRASGLDELIGRGLAGWIEGRPSWQVVLGVVACIALFSEIASNTATAQVLLPVLASAAEAAGLNPLVVLLPATLAASVGFMLPVGTPPNALAYATRMVPAPVMARHGAMMDLLLIALITLVFHFWLRPLWGIQDALPAWAHAR